MKIKNSVVPAVFVAGIFTFLFANSTLAKQNELTIKSPDGKIRVAVRAGEHLSYCVTFHGQSVVGKSELGIIVDGQDLGGNAAFADKPETKTINETYPTRGVHPVAINHCDAAVIALASGHTKWKLEVRVFNDGVACLAAGRAASMAKALNGTCPSGRYFGIRTKTIPPTNRNFIPTLSANYPRA
ncbi:MAG TPA: glycoside hydrolase family 97 N-terminal domain-containing protein [Verrucomicrobiae bacterium]|jgi:hypothetical protein